MTAKTKTIRVVIKPPGEPPSAAIIPNTLEALQHAVGGYIELLHSDDLLLLCNEEGQLQGLPPNVSLAQYGVLVGTIVVLGQDANDPDEFGSLSDEQVAWALRRFA